MASLHDLLNTARDALAAQSFGLNVAGQNVATVNTDGYVRRSADLETRVHDGACYGSVNVADAVFLLSALFVSGSASPPPPGVFDCGPDPTDDTFDCAEYLACP